MKGAPPEREARVQAKEMLGRQDARKTQDTQESQNGLLGKLVSVPLEETQVLFAFCLHQVLACDTWDL